MLDQYRIAAYTRISVDVELDRDNTSIENQKAIIADYCRIHFPSSTVDYYEDRDRSGYTFEQRPDYYERLRPQLLAGKYDVLIVKDLSRFSRRTGKGLAEFEDLAEQGIRLIAIGDGVDYYPEHTDDWMKIKLYFFVNEMPVTDASRKVSDVIASRQMRGEWICSVPYGYVITNTRRMTVEVDEPAAEVVRTVFRRYLDGWGYKKIANSLTDAHIPTPRMRERARREAEGEEYKGKVRGQWSIATVSEMLKDDFYIGTLRERKYHRRKINGADAVLDESEHIIFEKHHPAIIDDRTFAETREQLALRTRSHYRGIKKYDNAYSGLLFCGDCGSPLFALSRKNQPEAYNCGTYHVRGRAGCTSHHVRADFLDGVLKEYVRKVRDNSTAMLRVLEEKLRCEPQAAESGRSAAETLREQIRRAEEELRALAREKVRDMARHRSGAEIIEETYDALIEEAQHNVEGLRNQLTLVADTTNTIVRVNRIARTVLELFDEILEKDRLDRRDLHLIVERILIYSDHIDVRLKADVDELLRTGTVGNTAAEDAVNFKWDTENNENAADAYALTAVQSSRKRPDQVFRVHVVSGGDPLEIFTDREGEVIFKKYSPIGELAAFAAQYAETLHKTCGMAVVICDRDAVIASAGISKKEYNDRKLSPELEKIMEGRSLYTADGREDVPVVEGNACLVSCAMPILTEGDVTGCVASVFSRAGEISQMMNAELESKLIQTAAGFLGRQLEA